MGIVYIVMVQWTIELVLHCFKSLIMMIMDVKYSNNVKFYNMLKWYFFSTFSQFGWSKFFSPYRFFWSRRPDTISANQENAVFASFKNQDTALAAPRILSSLSPFKKFSYFANIKEELVAISETTAQVYCMLSNNYDIAEYDFWNSSKVAGFAYFFGTVSSSLENSEILFFISWESCKRKFKISITWYANL